MSHYFNGFELCEERRELRLDGREVLLQPRALSVLIYLVRHRDRVVGKDELLEALWPGAIVTDGSLQRAISLVRAALRQGGADGAIRTYERKGYRFCAEVTSDTARAPADRTPGSLGPARDAFDRNAWDDAVAAFARADAESGLTATDLERWAYAALCASRTEAALAPLERAVATHATAGDRRGAARAALLLTQVKLENRETAVARGWHGRAGSLLGPVPECHEHGLLACLEARFRLLEGNAEAALLQTRQTRAIGERLADPDLEALGLVYEGLALLTLGDIHRGEALQDEAGAAVLTGEVTPWCGGTVYCGILWGCRNRADWDRAAQWTEQFTRWCERCALNYFSGTCRLHRAEVLSVCGRLDAAEEELALVRQELPATTPWAEGDAYRVLGDIRLTRGDPDGAEAAFRRAHALGWDPQPGMALLQASRGQEESAIRGLERILEDGKWTNRQRRGLVLATLVTVAAAAGRHERARSALDALDREPDLWNTPALTAEVTRCRGDMAFAEGRLAEAIRLLRGAQRAFRKAGSPLGAAETRLRLAAALSADGDATAAEMEIAAAEATFRDAGAPERLRDCQAMRDKLTTRPDGRLPPGGPA